jgi:selenocysteine lyase/cysteine desulfurase
MSTALPCQRALFDIPDDVAYLNAAAFTPVPRSVRAAGELGVLTKATPWTPALGETEVWAERARAAAARLIRASADDIAITGAVSHGIATAAKNVKIPPGSRVLMIEGEFPSLALVWPDLARAANASVEIVRRPADGDWTVALLEAITRPGAPPVGLAALTPTHWSDGTLIDLALVVAELRKQGALVVIDATQGVGVLDIDVAALAPDFLAFPTYKWVLGPYSLAFLYAAPHRQDGVPLENHGAARAADGSLRPTARRYDRGEFKDPIGLPMAVTGMEQVLAWGTQAVAARLRTVTNALADAVADIPGIVIPPAHLRGPHVLGLRFDGGMPAGLVAALATHNVYVADRQGVLRVSPHVYNDDADVARFATALRTCLAAG